MGGTFHERRLSGVRARDRVIPTHLFFGTRRGTACQLNDGALSIIGRSKSCKLTATAALRVGLFSGRPPSYRSQETTSDGGSRANLKLQSHRSSWTLSAFKSWVKLR